MKKTINNNQIILYIHLRIILKIRLKSIFVPLSLRVFLFWLLNFKSFHFDPLRLVSFQNAPSVYFC